MSVKKPIPGRLLFRYTRKLIQERNPLSAVNVGKPSLRSPLSVNIREFIQERNHGSALNVGNPFAGIQGFGSIGKHTKGKSK